MRKLLILIALLLSAANSPSQNPPAPQHHGQSPTNEIRVVVSSDGTADYQTIQQAVDHAPTPPPNVRLVIAIRPGTYRERLVIPQERARVTLLGLGKDPTSTVITYNMSAAAAGGTFLSSTVQVEGAEFEAENLTFQNSYGPGSQAVALSIHSDRAVLRHCRLLGWQDTLYAASGRQYYEDCYIEGAVDFIFGNARAVFDHCEIRSAGPGYVTAESRTSADDSGGGFVFRQSKLTAADSVKGVYLGRPWRPYARVIFIDTEMGAHIDPAGWHEWHPGETHSLDTAYYAEYDSSGPGGSTAYRDPHAKLLSAKDAEQFDVEHFLSGSDNWNPQKSPAAY
jgi:pectin methylesterase-like acyl-CoA thioesterase